MNAQPDNWRVGYLGGSDWSDVLSVDPYGCARRLWYEKRGETPDYPQEVTPAMQRGTEAEGLVLRRYCEETGASLVRGRRPRAKGMPAWWYGHEDAIADHPERGRGLVEAKTAGEWIWRKVNRDGLQLGYIAQAQHYIGLTGLSWCDLAMLWLDGWLFRAWTVNRDDEMLATMRTAGDRFMRQVEHGPAPDALDTADKRCGRCAYRRTCHGLDLIPAEVSDGGEIDRVDDPELEALLRQEREAAELAKDAADYLETVRTGVRDKLGDRPAIEVPGFRVYYRTQTSMRLDTGALRRELPDVATKYERPSVSRPLRIYPV